MDNTQIQSLQSIGAVSEIALPLLHTQEKRITRKQAIPSSRERA